MISVKDPTKPIRNGLIYILSQNRFMVNNHILFSDGNYPGLLKLQ